jgi:hypothetical protein
VCRNKKGSKEQGDPCIPGNVSVPYHKLRRMVLILTRPKGRFVTDSELPENRIRQSLCKLR